MILNLAGGRKYILITAAKEGLKEQGSDWASDKTPIAPQRRRCMVTSEAQTKKSIVRI